MQYLGPILKWKASSTMILPIRVIFLKRINSFNMLVFCKSILTALFSFQSTYLTVIDYDSSEKPNEEKKSRKNLIALRFKELDPAVSCEELQRMRVTMKEQRVLEQPNFWHR
jgi:hypothetical protein